MSHRHSVPVLTPYQLFRERWSTGCGSELCPKARKIVFAGGAVPCDILFVGEAPGISENSIGEPFVGPAGNLLKHLIDRALGRGAAANAGPHRIGYTNLLCCIPRNEEGVKVIEPPDGAVKRCGPRLQEYVHLCDGGSGDPSEETPTKLKLIVAVGNEARDWLDVRRRDSIKLHRFIPTIDIRHPAFILRANAAQQSIEAQRLVVVLQNAVADFVEHRHETKMGYKD